MTTTKFSPGDRVLCFDSSLPASGKKGTVKQVFQISVDVQHDDMLLGNYHAKQLRRLKKRKKVVWESQNIIECRKKVSTDGSFDIVDGERFCYEVLSQFLGKRVRIEITEAKPQDKGER